MSLLSLIGKNVGIHNVIVQFKNGNSLVVWISEVICLFFTIARRLGVATQCLLDHRSPDPSKKITKGFRRIKNSSS